MTGTVAIGYIHPGEVDGSFHESIVRLLLDDAQREDKRIAGVLGLTSGPRIADSRNELVKLFLRMPGDPEWLLMVDTDMVFPPSALDGVLTAADSSLRPIMGGLCFGGGRSGRVFPTLYRLVPSGPNTDPIETILDYPKDKVVKVDATGAAFLLIHRSVLEKMGQVFDGPAPWFSESHYKGVSFGEDWTFCVRAQGLDLPIHVHTGVKIGHAKTRILDEDAYEIYLGLLDEIGDGGIVQRYHDRLNNEKAEEVPTYAVVPFKGHVGMTADLAYQLAEQGVAGILLYNNGDPLREAEEDKFPIEVTTITDAKGWGLHAMWNDGVRQAADLAGGGSFNVAILNNDLELGTRCIPKLAKALRADKNLWAVSPRYDDRPGRGVPFVQGTAALGGMAGFAFMLKGEAVTSGQLPPFDEELNWWYGDSDFVRNVLHRGYKVGLVLAARVEHFGSVTASEEGSITGDVIAKDKARYFAKWGLSEESDEDG